MNSTSTTTFYLVSCLKNRSEKATALLRDDQGSVSGYKVGRALLSAALELATCTTAFIAASGSFSPVTSRPVSPSSRILCGGLCWGLGCLSRNILIGLRNEIPYYLRTDDAHSKSGSPLETSLGTPLENTVNRTQKIFNIVIVNDIHVGSTERKYNGIARACSHLVEGRLPRLLQNIEQQHIPDLIVNLGDLIRSETRDMDLQAYRRLMPHFKQLKSPVLHLVGNHELKKMSLAEVQTIWQEGGFTQSSYGYKEMGEFNLVWLGLRLEVQDGVKIPYLPEEQLIWLKDYFEQHRRPTILFTHCPIDNQNLNYDFYYEGSNRSNVAWFLENQEPVRDVITRSRSVVAVVQAHLHHFHAKQIDGVTYITCPAMVDNICAPDVENNMPGVYTLLTLDSSTAGRTGRFAVKVFSGAYSFAGYENAGYKNAR